MLNLKTIFLTCLLFLFTTGAFAKSGVISLTTAKNKMYSKVFNNSGSTLYCDCDWSKRKTDLSSCSLQSFLLKTTKAFVKD